MYPMYVCNLFLLPADVIGDPDAAAVETDELTINEVLRDFVNVLEGGATEHVVAIGADTDSETE